jgi:hypothetical protein
MIFITVRGPAGRQIYAGGEYDNPYGEAPVTIIRQAGTWTFETVKDNAVDYRGRVVDVIDGTNLDLDLQPVVPPEPTV